MSLGQNMCDINLTTHRGDTGFIFSDQLSREHLPVCVEGLNKFLGIVLGLAL